MNQSKLRDSHTSLWLRFLMFAFCPAWRGGRRVAWRRSIGSYHWWWLSIVTLASVSSISGQNLVQNPGFEQGTTSWFAHDGFGSLTLTTNFPHSGTWAALHTSRSYRYSGPAQSLINILQPGMVYECSAWVRVKNGNAEPVQMTMRTRDGRGSSIYQGIANGTAYLDSWNYLIGRFTNTVVGTLQELQLYFEGPTPGVDLLLDDVSVVPPWQTEANARIELCRKRDTSVRLVDPWSNPITNVLVDVRQTRHHFGFGSAISAKVLSNPNYAAFFRTNFEWSVFDRESQWSFNEPFPGNVSYATADAIAAWCRTNHLKLRGHCVFGEPDAAIPLWVKDLSDSNLVTALQNRLDSAVPHFQGTFQHWDVNNEMLHGAYFSNRLGAWVRPWMFQQVRALDPDVRLFVNDYDVVEGNLTEQYKQQVQELIAAGAEINGTGVQGHFGSMVDAEIVGSRIGSLAQLGLPIWITEYDSVNGDENARANNLESLYRMTFSNPSVEGILMGGFWAGSHPRGSNAAIVNLDWTLNAAGRRYQALLAEWTTTTNVVTDANGVMRWRGFHGDYELVVTLPNGAAIKRPLTLPPGSNAFSSEIVVNPREAPLVPAGAVWQYLDTGAVPPTNWTTLAFQETSWPSGRTQLGFGGGDEATLINSNRSRITTYFRRMFTVNEPGLWTGLLVRLLREDGAVVYLNGTEIFRSNLPQGPLLADTFALAEANGNDGTTHFCTNPVDLSLLRRGTNVLAVEVHQCGTNSPGLSFDLELIGTQSSTLPRLTATRVGEGLTLTWPAWGLDFTLYSASNLTPPVAWSQVTNTMRLSNSVNSITVDDTGRSRFFRLQRQ